MENKIRILFISANPMDTGRIGVDKEAREVFEKLEQGSQREAFELYNYPALKAGNLQRLLMKHTPHIVHFSGHGSLAEKIILEGASGKGKQIGTEGLVDVFRLFTDHVRVVVLNACLTKPQAKALTEVVDYAIGITRVIGDRAAVTFAGAFYLALAFGMPIEKAFASAKAELKIQNVRRAKGLELMIRAGVDVGESFPPNAADAVKQHSQTLRDALQHVIDGNANGDETRRVRRATVDGSLVLEQDEETIEGEAEFVETSNRKGPPKTTRAQVNPTTYRRIQERLFPPPPGIGPPLPGLIVVGREDSLVGMKRLLTPADKEPAGLNLTVVRGWPGVGKTTLVGVLGRDPEVLKAFPQGVLWTGLERKPELMTKMAEWGRALGTDDLLRAPTIDEATLKLGSLLRHRQMLLIVDDIWDPAHAVPFLKAAANSKCALLATTRLTEVAEAMSPDERRIFVLPVLTEADSLILLRYLAPAPVERYPDECRQLVGDLGYLPLALHVAGKLLKAEAKIGLSIVDLIDGIRSGAKLLEEPAPIDRTEGTVLPTVRALLNRSTDELDELTRNCFAYLGPFAPKPATFDAAAMKAVWQIDDPGPIIRKLVGHGLLEPVGMGRFQMHELLVSHARSLLT